MGQQINDKSDKSLKHLPTCCSRPHSQALQAAWFRCSGLAWATASSDPVENPAVNHGHHVKSSLILKASKTSSISVETKKTLHI